MLIKEPNQRPSVHQILRHPLVEQRIRHFLDGSSFRDEFSHTLLHN